MQTRTMKQLSPLTLVLLLIMLVAVWGSGSLVYGAEFTVDTTADAVDINPGDGVCDDGAGNCTLRAAIQEANALGGSDTITLPAGTYTISIPGTGDDTGTMGDLDITRDLTITGAGSGDTIIDGGALDRVIHILSGNVDISGVTIQNGNLSVLAGGAFIPGGAGIFIRGTSTLTLSDSTIRGNDSGVSTDGGGGIFIDVPSTMSVSNSIISDNTATHWGGGFHNHGVLTISNSTLSGNTAGDGGGGLTAEGTSTLIDSTVSGNTATFGGGLSSEGTLILINTTVSNNIAAGSLGGGGIYNVISLTVTNSTITGNDAAIEGGGIYNLFTATAELVNTIVAGNTAPASPNCRATFTSLGYNLIGDDTGCDYVATIGDLVGTADNPVDPLLGPLQNNGGETETHALLVGSPAFDAIPVDACNDVDGNPVTTDQRGVARPQGTACDIGVFEKTVTEFGPPVVITTAADNAQSVFAVDLDGDGDMDALSASLNDDKIAWYENTAGDGSSWAAHTITTAADGPRSVYAADLDGDGDIDVLSASRLDDKIAWYENTAGDGSTWTDHTITTDAASASSVYAADVDGDGDLDVLSASSVDDKIAWYENIAGDGSTWAAHTITTAADSARSVYAADVDGDGDLDVLSASWADDKISWYENTAGDGSTWTDHTIAMAADEANAVYAADVDGDGDIDVLSASEDDDKISWYENTAGDGSAWTEHAITTTALQAQSVYAADLDGDGDIDALSASDTDDKIAWYENTAGDGSSWEAHTITTAANEGKSVYAADVDGDGDLDVLSASSIDDKIAWYENLGVTTQDLANGFEAHLSGHDQVPPVRTGANAMFRSKLNHPETGLRYELIVDNIHDITAAHIHCAPLDRIGDVGVTLFSGGPLDIQHGILAEGRITAPDLDNACGWTNLDDIVAGLRSGDTYVNVHTVEWPDGEVRGQLEPLIH